MASQDISVIPGKETCVWMGFYMIRYPRKHYDIFLSHRELIKTLIGYCAGWVQKSVSQIVFSGTHSRTHHSSITHRLRYGGQWEYSLCRKWCKFLKDGGAGAVKEKGVGEAGMHITSFIRKEDNKHLYTHSSPIFCMTHLFTKRWSIILALRVSVVLVLSTTPQNPYSPFHPNPWPSG